MGKTAFPAREHVGGHTCEKHEGRVAHTTQLGLWPEGRAGVVGGEKWKGSRTRPIDPHMPS